MYFRYKIGYKSCCYYFQINHEDGSPFSKIGAAIFEQMPAAWLETFFMHNVRRGALKYYKIISENIFDRIEIWDEFGRLLKSWKTTEKKYSIAGIPPGVYVLRVSQGNNVQAKKIIVL